MGLWVGLCWVGVIGAAVGVLIGLWVCLSEKGCDGFSWCCGGCYNGLGWVL